MTVMHENRLGAFLRARRARIDPSASGLSLARRRTPGLRREEVASRANISAKWYTFLEQGRGGAPSAEVLDRLSGALELSGAEREHLVHLAQPPRSSAPAAEPVPPALQRLLDAMECIPAFVKTPAWDIVAWNRAGTLALTDYGALSPERRNLLRLLFRESDARSRMSDWESHARFAVATFRRETARSGLCDSVVAIVDELSAASPEFAALWADNEVGAHGLGVKRVHHPVAGPLCFEYATLAVNGRPDLALVTFTPATPADAGRVKALLRPDATDS